MKKVIYKYEFGINDDIKIETHENAQLLKIGIHNNIICFWYLIEPKDKPKRYKFKIVGTGQEFEHDYAKLRFVDTVIDGGFVWHIFEDCSAEILGE